MSENEDWDVMCTVCEKKMTYGMEYVDEYGQAYCSEHSDQR